MRGTMRRGRTVTVMAGIAGIALAAFLAAAPLAAAATTTSPPVNDPFVSAPPVSGPPVSTPATTSAPSSTVPVNDPFDPVPPPGANATAHVSIVDFGFSPATVTVAAGTTVTWTNTGAAIHSVTSNSGAFDSSPTCPAGPCIDPGSSYSHRFDQAGTFAYHCKVHPNMTGTVVVNGAPTTTTAASSTTAPGSGNPPVSAGSTPPSTAAPQGSGGELAFTGTSSTEGLLALGALGTIALGLALRPRRRPFPEPPKQH